MTNHIVSIGTPHRLCHLPLVMDVLRRIGLPDVLDHTLRDDPRSKVSTSECVSVMLCGVFAGHHDLWRMSERLAPYDMATVMRDANFPLAAFTEERLAKMLDDLYPHIDRLMTAMALQTVEQFRLGTDFLHFDTTSLSFFGAHEQEDFASFSDAIVPTPPLITFGYSKDKRPDLKQVMYGTLVSSDGGVPLFGQALDGNSSDGESTAAFFRHIRSLVRDPREVCCVADSKGWCASVLDLVQRERLRLLSRLPRSHRLHRELMEKPWSNPRRIDRPARQRTEAPDYYELIGDDVEEELLVKRQPEDPQAKMITERLNVPARAVRVFSSALMRQKQGTLARNRVSEARDAAKRIRGWQAIAYACDTDAQRAAERHVHEADYVTIDLHATITRVEGPLQRGRGRPRKCPEPALAASHYRIVYHITQASEDSCAQRLRAQATFILIRTRNDGWNIDDAELIDRYKGQYHNEHGFAWLKSGPSHKGLNPIYLATPTRIASLCFLYCVGLIIWTLIQRTVRAGLVRMGKGLPYRRGKPSNRITTRFLFELFPLLQTVPCVREDGMNHSILAGMTETTKLACRALGTAVDVFSPVVENRG
jgi:transposase